MIRKIREIAAGLRRNAPARRSGVVAALLIGALVSGAIGFIIGNVAGKALIGDFMTGGGRLASLLYRPSSQYINATAMLGSDDELRRLAGYYALLESDSIDAGFLIERFKMERLPVVRRTIVWMLGFARSRSAAFDACAELYLDAPKDLRPEILSSMKRLDEGRYLEFQKGISPGAKSIPGR